jgi:hypothetical protein
MKGESHAEPYRLWGVGLRCFRKAHVEGIHRVSSPSWVETARSPEWLEMAEEAEWGGVALISELTIHGRRRDEKSGLGCSTRSCPECYCKNVLVAKCHGSCKVDAATGLVKCSLVQWIAENRLSQFLPSSNSKDQTPP